MSLINLQEISLSFGGLPVLENITFQIEQGERVCLIGRNGEGKSSLIRLIAGDVEADRGKIIRRQGLRVSSLNQEVPQNLGGSVFDIVAGGLGELVDLLKEHHRVSTKLAAVGGNESLLAELESVHHKLDAVEGWQVQQRVDSVLSRLQLDADQEFSKLSGGLKKRVLLARALVGEPDLLLLDEPTNHLDIDSITWLEEFLLTSSHTLLFVTHDRMLLKKLATRILDLDRGVLSSWPGNYDTYLRRKEEMLSTEQKHQAKFDRKLAQEEIWIRQGIKARRTRNEGRVKALVDMRRERKARREQTGKARMVLQEAETSGRLVVRAKNISYKYDDKIIINKFSTTILRGDKIGVIGPNGIGKTTLLQLLLEKLEPCEGSIRYGTNLLPVYFDQHRTKLDEEKTVAENVGEGKDMLTINGRPKHIIGYMQDFLFTPDRARSPVSILSGGERNRLLLAKLFSRPANILVLDEPTNDLDTETLDLLEELIFEFKGTVLVVSHDREFVNNVVTSTLVFEGDGHIQEYAGGYDDWLSQRPEGDVKKKGETGEGKKKKGRPRQDSPRKLTFKEIDELENLPHQIEEMEEEQQKLYDAMADPSYYQQESETISKTKDRLEELENILSVSYERWEVLEAIQENFLAWKEKK